MTTTTPRNATTTSSTRCDDDDNNFMLVLFQLRLAANALTAMTDGNDMALLITFGCIELSSETLGFYSEMNGDDDDLGEFSLRQGFFGSYVLIDC